MRGPIAATPTVRGRTVTAERTARVVAFSYGPPSLGGHNGNGYGSPGNVNPGNDGPGNVNPGNDGPANGTADPADPWAPPKDPRSS